MDDTQTLTAEERQRRLNDASRAYMAGKMDVEAFAAIKRQYQPDYASAIRTLAREQKSSRHIE